MNLIDVLRAEGFFTFECWQGDRLVWTDIADNVVCTLGKNLAFNSFLNGSNYTVTGPYMGLISGQGFSAVSATDTMASHPGWLEAGSSVLPTYTAPRPTCVWAAAANGSISIAGTLAFNMTSGGTVQGAFITYGPGASNAIDSTGGTLWSASTFQNGPQVIPPSGSPPTTQSVLRVSYTVSM